MAYRAPQAAPVSRIPSERRGRVAGRFCHGCGFTYPPHAGRHRGQPLSGKDHISSPCPHMGEVFDEGEPWWEPAVEVLPPPVAEEA